MEMQRQKRVSHSFMDAIGKIDHDDGTFSLFGGANREWASNYFVRSLKRIIAIDGMQDEIELVLSRLGETRISGLLRIPSIDELVVGLKFYWISWSTMKDLFHSAISHILDIGIDDRDLNYGLLCRSSKFSQTKLPEIIKAHSQKVNFSRATRSRNLAAHQGILDDPEVVELQERRNSIRASRLPDLLSGDKPITEEQYDLEMAKFRSQLLELVDSKRKDCAEHYQRTLDLYYEMAAELARIMVATLNGRRI